MNTYMLAIIRKKS